MGFTLGGKPLWRLFIAPTEQKTHHFASQQESARKDIECAFGVLQTLFAVIQDPAYGLDHSQINDITMTCIILHSMIVKDEQDNAHNTDFLNYGELVVPLTQQSRKGGIFGFTTTSPREISSVSLFGLTT